MTAGIGGAFLLGLFLGMLLGTVGTTKIRNDIARRRREERNR